MLSDPHLYDYGYSDPLHESPVETPQHWNGGEVTAVGGGIHVRRWTTDAWWEEQDKMRYEIIYDVSQDLYLDVLEVKNLRYTERDYQRGPITHPEADEQTDEAMWNKARELMDEYTPPIPETDSTPRQPYSFEALLLDQP